MKERVDFSSSLAGRMIRFIAFKRMQGYDYYDGIQRLRRLDSFLAKEGAGGGVLHAETLKHYCDEMAGLSESSISGYQSTARQFSIYLHACEPESAVLPVRILPRHPRRIRFHPLSEDQITDLMDATEILVPKCGIRKHCFRFLIGMLYCTGLRISEALTLNLQDVNTECATLFIRRGKFRKERLVAMSPSTLEAVTAWLRHRQQYAGSEASAPLFVVRCNRRLSRDQAIRTFRRLCRHCGIDGDRPPCLHDLRHNYASRCIARWRENGEDVNALLPVLANAMGHVDFRATQIYLHIDAVSLQGAADKFYKHIRYTLENPK